jgi:DNA-binding transcriptional ArsR family regulator
MVCVTELETAPDQLREVGDVETLKALADPIRLRIIHRMMTHDEDGALPVMTVKELATELAEPQTKLYRHVKQLEAVALIRAVSSRVVSGIVEQRYQACQGDLWLGAGLTEEQKKSAEAEAATAAVLDLFGKQFFAARRAGLVNSEADMPSGDDVLSGDDVPSEQYRRTMLGMTVAKVSKAHAASFRERLQQLMDELSEAEADAADRDDVVTVNVLLGYYSSDSARTAPRA